MALAAGPRDVTAGLAGCGGDGWVWTAVPLATDRGSVVRYRVLGRRGSAGPVRRDRPPPDHDRADGPASADRSDGILDRVSAGAAPAARGSEAAVPDVAGDGRDLPGGAGAHRLDRGRHLCTAGDEGADGDGHKRRRGSAARRRASWPGRPASDAHGAGAGRARAGHARLAGVSPAIGCGGDLLRRRTMPRTRHQPRRRCHTRPRVRHLERGCRVAPTSHDDAGSHAPRRRLDPGIVCAGCPRRAGGCSER